MAYFRNRKSHLRREIEIKEFRVACGEFVGLSDMSRKEWEKPGRALVPDGFRWAADMFAVRARGGSMEPMIRNRMWCLFHPNVFGTRPHRLVLVEDRRKSGIDRYTLKKVFQSQNLFLRWDVGARGNLVTSVESRIFRHPSGRRWLLSHLWLVCGCRLTNPPRQTVSVPIRSHRVGD